MKAASGGMFGITLLNLPLPTLTVKGGIFNYRL
jgi:hypothetical protein